MASTNEEACSYSVEIVTRTLRHEVGDLLQSVYSAVAILQERLPGSLGVERTVLADLRTRAEMCKNELDAVHDLVCSLSVNADGMELSELAKEITATFARRYPRLEIVCEVPRTVKIWGDSQRLKQVGTMLMTSFCQAARSKILQRVATSVNGSEAEWSFYHDGPAADTEQLSWLSAPFRTTRHARFGLGLALARRVVELHGGRITTATPWEGFALTLSLPLHPPQATLERTEGAE